MSSPITITGAARREAQKLLASRGKPSAGIRIGVRSRGCSGLSYTLEYADEIGPYDEVVEVPAEEEEEDGEEENGGGFRILIDPKAVMFLIGTEMDYVEEEFKAGFEFRNPNEKGRCGCGESFTV